MNKLSLKENDTLFNNQFKILKVIGNGGFSFVYHVKYLNMRDFAIKEFFISKYFQRAEDKKSVLFSKESNCKSQYSFKHNFFNEAILMKSFCHPNILSSFGYFEENNTIYNVMPLLKGITLSEYIEYKGKLSEDEALSIIKNLSLAVKYLHSKKICHFDIKPNNVLLQNGSPILIDFGLSYDYNRIDTKGSRIRSISPGYAALELFENNGVNRFSPATDIFGLGATLYAMLTGTNPPSLKSIWHGALYRPLKSNSMQTKMAIKTAMQILMPRRFSCVDQFLQALP
ncbi:MAG: serine/threonine protein kinase [Bacteroides sp.]|nr:serine/threonine protein kinase [Bacteroides sp.]